MRKPSKLVVPALLAVVLGTVILTSSPTLAFGHREGDSCCATHELPLA